jgi:hypothetical protein
VAADGVHEPTPSEVERATGALLPFVRRWGLALNPENVQFMAYAALRHATGTLSPEGVWADVEQMLDEDEAAYRRMQAKMHERPDEEG